MAIPESGIFLKKGFLYDAVEALRDKDDAVFIRLAQTAGADYVISGDRHLLELRELFPELHIVSLAEFMERSG